MNVIDAVILDTQNEFAPDSPFGRQVLELDARGGLKYRQQRQVVLAEVTGHVTNEGFLEIVDALKLTSFPAAPQRTFVPGASVYRLTTLPSNESVSIDYFEAMKIVGYKDAMRRLTELMNALRTDNQDVLNTWKFEKRTDD